MVLLGLGDPQQHPYVNAGHLIFSSPTASRLLPLLVELQATLDMTESFVANTGETSHPFYYADQDLLNAILCTCDNLTVTRLDRRLSPHPPFVGVRVKDSNRLLCEYADGLQPHQLHHTWRKPWLVPMKRSPYSTLFTRVVTGPELSLRIDEREVPLRLRGGVLGAVERHRASIQPRFRGRLGLRPRVERIVRKSFHPRG